MGRGAMQLQSGDPEFSFSDFAGNGHGTFHCGRSNAIANVIAPHDFATGEIVWRKIP